MLQPVAPEGETPSSRVEIREVATARDHRRFVGYPYGLYRGDQYWVPPLRLLERDRLNRRRNHFFDHADSAFLLAEDEGRLVGRIAVFDDHRHNETHADNLASFGFFEAASADAARALLAAAEQWARTRARTRIRGPLNPSLNDTVGLLIDGFEDPPAILMPYNPPEYPRFLESAGYAKVKDLFAWSFDLESTPAAQLGPLVERVAARIQPTIHFIERRQLNGYVPVLGDLYRRAWADSWGFVPPTDEEMRQIIGDLSWIVGPRDVVLIEIAGQPAAFGVCIRDINQVLAGTDGNVIAFAWRWLRRRRIITRGRFVLLGVAPEFRQLGIFPLLAYQFYREFKGTYRHIEDSWVLEDNANINESVSRFAHRSKTYRLYEKTL